jgi:hypothetical protein
VWSKKPMQTARPCWRCTFPSRSERHTTISTTTDRRVRPEKNFNHPWEGKMSDANKRPPSTFETFAGVGKFIAVSRVSPQFYEQHTHPVEMACAFLRILASEHPALERALRASLSLPLAEGAAHLEVAFQEARLGKAQLSWLDAQSTEVLRGLVPVVRDSSLPNWLAECRWAVLGAFE